MVRLSVVQMALSSVSLRLSSQRLLEMIRATRAAGQFEAVPVAHDVKLHGQRLSGLFIQRCRQLAAEIFQIASKIDLYFVPAW